MPFSLRAFGLLALTLPFLAACDSADPEPDRVGISGRWAGDLTYVDFQDTTNVQVFPVDMTLTDVVSGVTGSGSVVLPDETLTFAVLSGLYDSRFRTVTLELRFDRPPQGTLSGIVSPERDRIDGTMGGPGLVNGEVELVLALERAP